jgi:hypothetical protein
LAVWTQTVIVVYQSIFGNVQVVARISASVSRKSGTTRVTFGRLVQVFRRQYAWIAYQFTQAQIEGYVEAQGYLTGRPMPAEQALALLGVEAVEDPGLDARDRRAGGERRGGGCALGNVNAFSPRRSGAPGP